MQKGHTRQQENALTVWVVFGNPEMELWHRSGLPETASTSICLSSFSFIPTVSQIQLKRTLWVQPSQLVDKYFRYLSTKINDHSFFFSSSLFITLVAMSGAKEFLWNTYMNKNTTGISPLNCCLSLLRRKHRWTNENETPISTYRWITVL